MTSTSVPTFVVPEDLRLSIQKSYMNNLREAFPDITVEEMTEFVTNNLDEVIDNYDEWDACADLEPKDHRYFEREINWAEWLKHIFTGTPISFITRKQYQTFGADIADRVRLAS